MSPRRGAAERFARRAVRAVRRRMRGGPAPAAAPDAAGRALVRGAIEGIKGLGSAPIAGGGSPIVLAYHPRVSTNPYQRLLYARCLSSGIVPVNLSHLGGLSEAPRLKALGTAPVLHIHWTHKVLAGATGEADARRRIDGFAATLDRFVADGGRIVWTLHNVVPHEHRSFEAEVAVCDALARRAHAIHVMCDETAAATAEAGYTLPPDRVHLIPHPSYLGVYPNYLAPSEARASLGFTDEHTVLTAFGGIRGYKGLDVLLDAFEAAAARDPSLRLVIAGQPIAFDGADALAERCARHRQITAHLATVPPEDVQRYLVAADAVVLPHQRVLNSGLLGLAYAFERPVIAPSIGCVTSQVSADTGVLFEPEDRAALERAIAGARQLREPRYRDGTRAAAQATAPDVIAARFAELIRSLVTTEVPS